MPYGIIPVDKKFMVIDTTTGRKFSKKALPKAVARKQRIAIALSESKKTGKPVSSFFV
jgi:hypothetical protein